MPLHLTRPGIVMFAPDYLRASAPRHHALLGMIGSKDAIGAEHAEEEGFSRADLDRIPYMRSWSGPLV